MQQGKGLQKLLGNSLFGGLHLASHAGKLRDSFQGTLSSVLVDGTNDLDSDGSSIFEYAMEGVFASNMEDTTCYKHGLMTPTKA